MWSQKNWKNNKLWKAVGECIMSLNHSFLAVDYSFKINNIDLVYDYIIAKKIVILSEVKIHDDFLQLLLFGKDKICNNNINYNEWGIDIIEGNNILNWCKLLEQNETELGDMDNFKELKNILLFAIQNNYRIIHLGI